MWIHMLLEMTGRFILHLNTSLLFLQTVWNYNSIIALLEWPLLKKEAHIVCVYKNQAKFFPESKLWLQILKVKECLGTRIWERWVTRLLFLIVHTFSARVAWSVHPSPPKYPKKTGKKKLPSNNALFLLDLGKQCPQWYRLFQYNWRWFVIVRTFPSSFTHWWYYDEICPYRISGIY